MTPSTTQRKRGSKKNAAASPASENPQVDEAPASDAPVEDGPAPVEDVTGKETETAAKTNASLPSLFKTLLAEAKKVGGRGSKTTEKQAYTRVDDPNGKTVAYVNKPTRKHVRLEIPKGSGEYNVVTVASDDEVPTAVKAMEARHVPTPKSAAAAAPAETASAPSES